MKLFHGTNRRIKKLKPESYLTDNVNDAFVFSHAKGGGCVYVFEVDENQIERDRHTKGANWFLNKEELEPINVYWV